MALLVNAKGLFLRKKMYSRGLLDPWYNGGMTDEQKKRKNPRNFRLSDHAEATLEALEAKLGINKTKVVEMAVRKLGEREGIKIEAQKES